MVEEKLPILEGDVISFRCTGFSQTGVPLRPVICKIRGDLTWKDVLESYYLPRIRDVEGMFFYMENGLLEELMELFLWQM